MHKPYTLTIPRLGCAEACRTPGEAQRVARHIMAGVPGGCTGAIYGPGLPAAGMTVR